MTPGERGAITVGALIEEVLVPRLLAGSITVVVSETAEAWVAGAGGAVEREGDGWPGQHAHGGHEICWVISGRCLLSMLNRRYLLDRGVAFLVTPGEMHRLGPTPSLEPFEVLWWSLTPRGVSLPVESFMGERQVSGVGFVTLEPRLTATPSQVVREVQSSEVQSGLVARAILLQLAGVILRHLAHREMAQQASWDFNARVSQHVQRVAHYIETHYGTDITLDRLARVAGVSPSYLTTLFRRYTGRSALAYLSDVRQRHAIELLRNTDLEVAAVARLVGYEDPYYFSRVFKERNGCSPRAFRHQYIATPAAGPAATSSGR